jgi:hypothetical protein
MRRLITIASIVAGYPSKAAAIGHLDRERFTRARHARHEPGRLHDQFRNLSGKRLLRRVIKIALEKGEPRRQTFGGRRLDWFEQILHGHASGPRLGESRRNTFWIEHLFASDSRVWLQPVDQRNPGCELQFGNCFRR